MPLSPDDLGDEDGDVRRVRIDRTMFMTPPRTPAASLDELKCYSGV